MHYEKEIETDFRANIIHEEFEIIFEWKILNFDLKLWRGHYSKILEFSFNQNTKETKLIAFPSSQT